MRLTFMLTFVDANNMQEVGFTVHAGYDDK